MKQIHDNTMLDNYLRQYQINSLFDTNDISFHLYQYDKGELLNYIHDSACFLQFLVKGSVRISSIREDGSHYPIGLQNEFTLLGDMEFCGETALPLLVEACEKVICVGLPLYEYRTILLNDNTFLRFLLHSIAHKMALFSQSIISFTNLEEKLLHYMKYDCPGQQFQGVEAAAIHLRCSRRQLQRLLKILAEKKLIEKIGKGKYRLI